MFISTVVVDRFTAPAHFMDMIHACRNIINCNILIFVDNKGRIRYTLKVKLKGFSSVFIRRFPSNGDARWTAKC